MPAAFSPGCLVSLPFVKHGHRASAVISLLDQKLKAEKTLNMGGLADMLIFPPFGCNIASAALILGVFVSPRKDQIALLFKGREIEISGWIGEVFSRNFVDAKKLKETEIRYVTESETGEWQELLAMWDLEPTHAGRVNFFHQAESLNERIKIPAGYLHEKYKRLRDQAEESFRILTDFREFLDKQEDWYFRAYERGNVANLSRVGKDMADYMEKMASEENAWMPDQFKMIRPKIEKAKQAVIQFFDPWLQEKSILKSQQIGDFKHRMIDQVGGNLKKLELNELYKNLEKHVNKMIHTIEERQHLSYIVDETRAFLDSRKTDGVVKISELNSWAEQGENLLKSLRKSQRLQPVPDLEQMIARMTEFRKVCKDQVKFHKNRAQKLWNRRFSNLEDVRSARCEVKELMDIFFGQALDMEDLQMMDRQLGQFERDIALWNDFSLPTGELKKSVTKRIAELAALQSGDDPPWDVEQVYGNVLENILGDRMRAASDWMESVSTGPAIETMSAETCQTLLNRLNPPPAYLESDHFNQIDKMRARLEKRLDDLQVEGLLVRFRELPPESRVAFLKIAQMHVGDE